MTKTLSVPNSPSEIEMPGILEPVRSFYSGRIVREGATPAGVDWPDERRQQIRFRELCRLFPNKREKFTVLDYGCGYGALLPYLRENGFSCDYYGFDICEEMIEMARRLHPDIKETFLNSLEAGRSFDYVVSSGALSRKQDTEAAVWDVCVWETIDVMNGIARKGFGFNVLSAWREPGRKEAFLYYGDPAEFLKQVWKYSPNIALLHDYDLWDFTILVRKDIPYVKDMRRLWVRP